MAMSNSDHRQHAVENVKLRLADGFVRYKISGEEGTFGYYPNAFPSSNGVEFHVQCSTDDGRDGIAIFDLRPERLDELLHQLADECGYELVEVSDDE